jgi:hypothetical protein
MQIIQKINSVKAYFFFVFIICNVQFGFAQKYVGTKLYAKPMIDSILLRWQVYDDKVWDAQLKLGFDIYRKSQSGIVVKINDSIIKALNPQEFALRYLKIPVIKDTVKYLQENANTPEPDFASIYKPDITAQKAMGLLFANELGATIPMPGKDEFMYFGDDPTAIRSLFHSMLCLSNREAAIVSGLFYADKKIIKGEKYTYFLTKAGKGLDGILAQTTLSSTDPYVFKKPLLKKDYYSRGRVILAWDKIDTLVQFIPIYNVYRSDEKKAGYKKLNVEPIYALYDGPSIIDTMLVSSTDTTIEKGKSYYYKVRGVDVFGEYSPYSEPYLVSPKIPMEYAPLIIEIKKVGSPYQINLKWQIQPKDEENVASIQLFKSTKQDTLFVPLSIKFKLSDRNYSDKNLTKNNYYKLLMIGKAGDSLWSSPAYMLVPDSIPPAAPVIKSAICDSLGRVTITWSHNKEIDLYGFYIYKGNYKNEEFARIANILRVDTIYVDTISLRVMDDAVYYEVVALDDSYNRSLSSNIMRAKRYDTIKPTSAVFRTFKSTKKGILLEWGNSSSFDVVKTTLYRKLKGEIDWHVYKVFARDQDKYSTFIDTLLQKGYWYEYKLQTTDDDNLVSNFSNTLTIKAYDDGIRAEIKNVKLKSNTRKGIVKISWEYGYVGVKNFQIFRGADGKKPIILKSITANTYEFYDTEIRPGKTYTYIIKAEFNDGGESPFTKPIIVQVK